MSTEELENKYCQEYDAILVEDGKWTSSDEERKLGTRIDRIHDRRSDFFRKYLQKVPKLTVQPTIPTVVNVNKSGFMDIVQQSKN
jgi:hypothetical protein